MPNKTIYVSDGDLALFNRAQELAGGSLSAAITTALRRFVDIEEGRESGFEEIVVKVGVGKARRKQRFSGVLIGEWGSSTKDGVAIYRAYRSRTGKYVVHVDRSPEWSSGPDAERWSTGWRAWVGNWSANQTWGFTPTESTLHIADSLDELRPVLPVELFDVVADAAAFPTIEDLDI